MKKLKSSERCIWDIKNEDGKLMNFASVPTTNYFIDNNLVQTKLDSFQVVPVGEIRKLLDKYDDSRLIQFSVGNCCGWAELVLLVDGNPVLTVNE